MSSTVHYKLKSSSSANSGAASGGWSTLHFDGVYLSILEFKRKVIYKEQWCKSEADANFDLLVSNSNSGEEYRDDTYSVHRNVSVLVKRIPAASPAAARKLYIPLGSLPEDWNKSTSTWVPPGMISKDANTNLTPLGVGGAGEEGDIAAMMQQRGSLAGSRGGRAPSGPFQPSFNTRTLTPTSKPPGGYVCHRCKQPGHYIQFCPTNGDHKYDMAQRSSTTREDREREREREKEKVQAHVAWGERDYSEGGGGRPSRHGAPAVAPSESAARWLKPVVDPKGLQAELNGGVAPVVEETPAQLKQRMFPSQFFAASAGSTVPVTNPTLAPHDPHAERMAAYARAVAETAPSAAAVAAPAGPLRPDLTCSLCGDYFSSASVLGCCYTSFCLECIQQHLQKTGACPSCASTDVTVEDLQPNGNLQKAVDAFLLEHPSIVRGAIKQQKAMAAAAAAAPATSMPPAAPAPAPSHDNDRHSDDRDSRGGSYGRSDDRGRSRERDPRSSYPPSTSAPLLPAPSAYPGGPAPWMQPQPGMPMGGAYGMPPPMPGYPGAYGMPMQMPYGMQPQMQMGGYGMHPMQMQMQQPQHMQQQQHYAASGGANGYPMQMQQQQQQPPPHHDRHRSRSRSRERDQHRR